MRRGPQGRFEQRGSKQAGYVAFIPRPLPPDPPLRLSDDLQDLLERANRALGRLDGLATLLPDPTLFLYLYIRKEAVLSSQIEGTQSSFSELLLFESSVVPGVGAGASGVPWTGASTEPPAGASIGGPGGAASTSPFCISTPRAQAPEARIATTRGSRTPAGYQVRPRATSAIR